MRKIIKISCVGTSIAGPDHSNPMISRYLPNKSNIWKDCEFYWNDAAITEADYWIIMDDINQPEEFCTVNKDNVILMTGEPSSIKSYDDSLEFINQFSQVYSNQRNLNHPQLFACKPPINWWVDAGHPIKTQEEFNQLSKNSLGYDDFKAQKSYEKTKLISVFCSNKVFTPGHKLRYQFCQKLKNHFKDKIDWFGAGVNPIENKWDGIAPYKYHIVLENSSSPDYWTEKLMDPYMVLTYPIYCGASNISKYFSPNQITEININHPKTAIAIIEDLLSKNDYESRIGSLLQARELVMDKYNLFEIIHQITASKKSVSNHKQLIKLKSDRSFLSNERANFVRVRKSIISKVLSSTSKKVNKVQNFIMDNYLFAKLKLCLLIDKI